MSNILGNIAIGIIVVGAVFLLIALLTAGVGGNRG